MVTISGERIWTEISKILMGKFVYEILSKIQMLNVGSYIGFPSSCNLSELKRVTENLKKFEFSAKPMTIFSSLFHTQEEITDFYLKIKASTFDKQLGYFIILNRNDKKEQESIK